jgi:hypothetical protein
MAVQLAHGIEHLGEPPKLTGFNRRAGPPPQPAESGWGHSDWGRACRSFSLKIDTPSVCCGGILISSYFNSNLKNIGVTG